MTQGLVAAPSERGVRAELLELVMKDLLGPAGGPSEEVAERSVQDRYLVGSLSPKRAAPAGSAESGDEEEEYPPVVHDELGVAGKDSVEEGTTDRTAALKPNLCPSSFGMSFCVDAEAEALKITARWGHYKRTISETLTRRDGEPQRVWKRTPREGVSPHIGLRAGKIRRWIPCEEQQDVYVEGLVRKNDHQWIVTLFFVNGQTELKTAKDSAWLFQPELIVEGSNRAPVFLKRSIPVDYKKIDCGLEEQTIDMLYRKRREFAVGHGVSVNWEMSQYDPERAMQIRTKVVPEYELPKVTPPTADDLPRLSSLVLDMKELADTDQADFASKLSALPDAYLAWIESQEKKLSDAREGLGEYQEAVKDSMKRCRSTLKRIEEGIALLGSDPEVAEAFQFMNRAMWLQRTRSIYSEQVRRGQDLEYDAVDIPRNRTWYPFQLAFVVINLVGISDPLHNDRTGKQEAIADLLWFPTGGGKTEAYLGLTAFTVAIRRLRKDLGGLDAENGIAVLMRYTLRLLTLQQFQRATALICACEMIRKGSLKDGVYRFGTTPFRIGLWVGQRSTPNTTAQSDEAIKQDRGNRFGGMSSSGSGSPHQLTNCPWCGSKIDPGKHIKVEQAPSGAGRTFTYCGDLLGKCPFSQRQSPEEGLPILVVDEEIYRRLPSLLIATVDKFAQLPWLGTTQMLFGKVDSYCERHGYRSSEIEDADYHRAAGNHPKAKTKPCKPLRPPDLIIQDELHLISGPLGSLVGLYETAVDRLCSWSLDGKQVHPKIVASTATIRRAQDQVFQIFARKVNIFPPNGTDVEDNFFALERDNSDENPGRLYFGICAPGRRQKAALIRVYLALMAATQTLYEKKGYGILADPWMTLVGYFNSLRELGGMRRLVLDDVRSRLLKIEERGLTNRRISETSVEELTSRKSSTQIPEILDKLEAVFDPVLDVRRKKMLKEGKREGVPQMPLDIVLATNMISVGVDVKRLGLMVVGGQPKTTAEYIQATSRVGRSFPGLVCTVFNWARPRDLSHYEQFEHYHSTFYKNVEALSVTPFSCGAIDKGLTALLVSCIRQMGSVFNENGRAGAIDVNHPFVKDALDTIVERAKLVTTENNVGELVRDTLKARLDEWLSLAQKSGAGRKLGYKMKRDGVTVGLLEKAGVVRWGPFTCLNSLRDVEPTVSLILDNRPIGS